MHEKYAAKSCPKGIRICRESDVFSEWKGCIELLKYFIIEISKHLKLVLIKQDRKPRSYTSLKLWPTHSLTGVKCRATSVAKNNFSQDFETCYSNQRNLSVQKTTLWIKMSFAHTHRCSLKRPFIIWNLYVQILFILQQSWSALILYWYSIRYLSNVNQTSPSYIEIRLQERRHSDKKNLDPCTL